MATKSTQVGIVTIQELSPARWVLRYKDPLTRKDVRKRVSNLEFSKVKKIAANFSQEALSEKGYLPGRKVALPSVHDAVAASIRLSSANAETKRNYGKRASHFERWIEANYSHVKTWGDLKPLMVEEYVREMEASGLAPDSIRLRLVPVKATWKRMAENYPDSVRPLPRIKMGSTVPTEEGIVCLDHREAKAYLDFLKERFPSLWPIACLQALAGLRLQEAAALRRGDIDFHAGTVRITATETHVPKNKNSYRTIPVCSEVLEALSHAVNQARIVPATGEVFLTRWGQSWNSENLTARWKAVRIKAAEKLKNKRIAKIPARKLRATFATMAGLLGVPDRLLKCYLGHAPGDVLGESYRKVTVVELRLVSSRMEQWKRLSKEADRGKIVATLEKVGS